MLGDEKFPGRYNYWCSASVEHIYIWIIWEMIRVSTILWSIYVYFQLNRKDHSKTLKRLIDYFKYFVIVLVGTWFFCLINAFKFYIGCIHYWDCDELPFWWQAFDALILNSQGFLNAMFYGKNLLSNTRKNIKKKEDITTLLEEDDVMIVNKS